MGNVLQNTGGNTLKVLTGGGFGSVASPSSLSATSDTQNPTVIRLSWEPVVGALWYEVVRADTAGGAYTTWGTNSYVWALDIDSVALSSTVTAEDWTLAPADTKYYKFRAFKNDYTYTSFSPVANATTQALTGSEVTVGGVGSDYTTLTLAMAAHTTGTAGIFVLEGDITDKIIDIKGGLSDTARVIVMNKPSSPRYYIDVNFSVETDYGMTLSRPNVTLQGIGLINGPNKVIKHGHNESIGIANNVTMNDLHVVSTSASTNNTGVILLGSQGNSSNILVQNCLIDGGIVGLHLDARHLTDVTCRYNEFLSSHGTHVKFNGDANKNIISYFEDYKPKSISIFSDGDYCNWLNCVISQHPASPANATPVYLAENYAGDYQKLKHLTIVGNTNSSMIVHRTLAVIDSVEVDDIFVAGTGGYGINNNSGISQTGIDIPASEQGATTDFVNYAGGDYTITSGAAKGYRTASDGADKGAFILGVGRTGAATA